ncbi:unnamed protein product [Lactuca virosa]|uniref:CCHC-type domain-containing protein n=1 Tax=Lactuca virosa TaxID=75947 RepID=A0AAU9M5V7_9ASTR|nr:unnamed protein product [Lactuca virosa]
MRIFYHCDQVGHVKTNCPQLVARPAQALALATLRITDGGQGRAEPLKARGSKTSPDVVADWLSRFGAMIDCEGQRVVVRTPSEVELVIYGEGTRLGT